MSDSIHRAREKPLFDGKSVFFLSDVKDEDVKFLRELVEASGGTVLASLPRKCPENERDISEEPSILLVGNGSPAPAGWPRVYEVEFLKISVMRQEADYSTFTVKREGGARGRKRGRS